jgi:anti-sigma B factor antagonist
MLQFNYEGMRRPIRSRLSEDPEESMQSTMLRLTIQKLGDISIFHCAGRIVGNDGDFLRDAVRSQSHTPTVILDLAEVSGIDAAGVGMLVTLREWAKATHTEFKLLNVTPRVEEVLRITNLLSSFDVCSFREMMDLLCSSSRLPQFTTFHPLPVAG